MGAYRPYKPVPIGRRCPHGYDVTECGTCVNAEQAARDYWRRQLDAKTPAAHQPAKEQCMSTMPNKLRLRNGQLEMIDGSDPVEYLRSRDGIPDGSDVVVLRRDKAEQLLRAAEAYRIMFDERFALAA